VPAAIFNAAGDTTGDGLKDISFSVRLADFPPGQRLAPTDRTTFRIVGGLEGDISSKWSFNSYYEYGQTTLNQSMSNVVNEYNMANALNVVTDVFDLNKNGSTTDAICADATARANGCVPLNIYGRGNLSQAAINYVMTDLTHDSKLTQEVVSGGVSGTLFNLPAGPVQLAAGVEYRRETSSDVFDPLSNISENGYVQEPNTSGSFDVKEAYGELQVPILHHSPIGDLSIRGAGRVSDYSTVGTVNAWNAGIEYSPIRDIRFRAVYARAVRAPNIGELYAPSAVTVTSVTDPCSGVTLTSSGTTSTRCRADPAVVANINANGGVFTLNQSDTQGATVVSSSNPNIQAENGTTYSFGVVINPASVHALRNLVLTADYFNISIAGAISRPSAQVYLNKCYVQNLDAFCADIQRRASAAAPYSVGAIQQISQALVNSGGTWTEGIDLTAGYHVRVGPGNATANLAYTHLFKEGQRPLQGDPVDNLRGEIGTPTDQATLTWGYDTDQFGFTVTNQYLGPQYLDDQYTKLFVLANGSLPSSSYFRVGAKVYTDAQVRFNVNKRFQLYLGADDIFNLTPPTIVQGLPGDVTNDETAGGVYDPIGRRLYAGFRARF
jgi:iron complex outermembrane recepter protein